MFTTTNNIYPKCRRGQGLAGGSPISEADVLRTSPLHMRAMRGVRGVESRDTGRAANEHSGPALTGVVRMSSQEQLSLTAPLFGEPRPDSVREDISAKNPRIRVERSALWAAYGDALGWISELTNRSGLLRRTSGEPLVRPIAWERRIGGRTGVITSLPQGCYSDDSQLRLSTSRAIGPDRFDVEAFAKIELPVWLSYALGGGRATSAAAVNLARPNVPWFANHFKGWTNSGGNGAAMRVQPHVWACAALERPESYLLDVVRNAVCTHSHPIGILGAVLHSLALAKALASGCCPSPSDLMETMDIAATLPRLIREDTEIGNYWLSAFQWEAGSFDEAWSQAVAESKEAISAVSKTEKNGAPEQRYAAMVEKLGLREPDQRGSGILTAVAAAALPWCDPSPERALQIAANAIGTDTDTIATMAGAILGATADTEPPVEVMDADLFRAEAARLSEIACGKEPKGHDYPDLLHWSAPKGRAHALARMDDGGLSVSGLGRAKEIDQPIQASTNRFQWQWLRLELGQSVLIKRCRELDLARAEHRRTGRSTDGGEMCEADSSASAQTDRSHTEGRNEIPERGTRREDRTTESERPKGLDLQSALEHVAVSRNDDKIVGEALRRVVNEGTPAEIAGFTAGLVELLGQSESTHPTVARQSGHRALGGHSPSSTSDRDS